MRFFCYSIHVSKPELLKTEGPLLIASNHPNSFLDAVFYDILFNVPIWSLARGDAFKNNWVARILRSLKIFPVYRNIESPEYLMDNYKTFDACIEVFNKNEAVTIFSEGICINEWHLRPLRKGTARLAFRAWEEGIPLKVLPAGINYSSFRKLGKKIDINLGEIITKDQFDLNGTDGNKNIAFNIALQTQLKTLVYEIAPGDTACLDRQFHIEKNRIREWLLLLPSLLGFLFHAPLFAIVKFIINKFIRDRDHYDSVMLGLLLFLYPLYIILVSGAVCIFTNLAWGWLLLLLLPLTALAYVKRKVIPTGFIN
jgi:1-acyl-sn-glycerol-3-phosphate acyltransferase